jgi:hypothetical protein
MVQSGATNVWVKEDMEGEMTGEGGKGHRQLRQSGQLRLEGGDDIKAGDENQTNIEALNANMVFVIPIEFRAPEASEVTELVVGAKQAVFEKPTKPGGHMKLLYVKGHIDETPVG